MAANPEIDDFGVDVRGGSLGVCRYGPADGLTTIVAVHGITGNSRAWLPIARELGARASVLAPDLRGRARSRELPGPFGLGAHTEDLLAVFDQLELERAVLAGHSLGAYICAQFALEHPDRVRTLVLVDGGLRIPGTEGVEPQAFADAFLGPALARLKLRFASPQEYLEWWHRHPAIDGADIDEADLEAYVEHDTIGSEPELRSAVAEDAVRGDAGELALLGDAAPRLEVAAKLMCAPRGLLDDPRPMQPYELVSEWAQQRADLREAILVEDTNHYTITLGARGSRAVGLQLASVI